ncbi:TSUP family transporter [Streptomyces sp. NPDC050548]|uniref:TSUP family transporter n=1 Tax=Streptomyces sp. NPDC050548 TaxID=3365629 RepID=UPI0037B4737B
MLFFRRRTGRITPGEARNRVQAGAAVLVDVRERVEWNAGHAPEAVHLPLSRLMAGAQLPGSAAGRPVVTVCRSGHRSLQAARLPSAGVLDWALVGPFLGAAILGAWDGKRIAAKIPARRLQRIFAVLLLTVAVFMLADALR